MKRIVFCISLLALMCLVTAAMAVTPVTVNFSGIVTPTDLTAPFLLDGISFSYDSLGSGDSATISSTGITGGNGGKLIFDFTAPATGLDFSFNAVDTQAFFSLAGNPAGANGSLPSVFSYSGPAFDRAEIYFDPVPGAFGISGVSYTPAVPEASTLVGFGSALALSGPGMFAWLRRRKY